MLTVPLKVIDFILAKPVRGKRFKESIKESATRLLNFDQSSDSLVFRLLGEPHAVMEAKNGRMADPAPFVDKWIETPKERVRSLSGAEA